jgi:aspartate aminotransferase
MPSSPIRRLVEFALRAEAEGVTVHYLNIGQPDIHSPAEFWAATKNHSLSVLEYGHSAGSGGLREAYAMDLAKKGIYVDPSEIMVTTGGSEACAIAFMTALDPGDEVITVEPFYANYAGFAVAAGVTLIPLTARIENDFALPSPAEIQEKITPRTKAILLCNPSNPTGQVFNSQELDAIAGIARDRGLFLMVDEVYRDFYYGQESLRSVMQIPDFEENAIMIDSASKKFSLCGARIGFLTSRNRSFMAAALKFGQARLSAGTLDMAGVEACLRETGPDYFATVKQEYMARRDLIVTRLSSIPGVKVPRIDGAFYAVVELPIDDSDKFCQWMVESFRHHGETVLMAPATGFYITPGLGKQEVRLAYVLDQDRLERAMDCLAAGLAAYDAK